MEKILERFNELKRKYPMCIVFMRCGDFYETYDADAQVCHDVLGLTLTKRNGKAQLLTGFPKHALEGYLKKLHDAGRSTVVCNETNNNSNNNQKTEKIMEKKFATIRENKVYWFNRDREALVKLVLVRQNFKLDTGRVTYEWAEADGDKEKVVLVTEYNPQEPDKLPRFYKNAEDFEKGVAVGTDELYWLRGEDQICRELLKMQHNTYANKDELGAFVWAFIKGQAVKWYFNKHIDVVTWHCIDGIACAKATADEEVPESYFNAESVYKYNDWIEVREDGERIVHEGVYKRLMLEPDQEELAEKLQKAIDACKDAGMKVYFNCASYDLNAVNMRHVDRIEYEPDVDEETERAYEFEDRRCAHVFGNVADLSTDGGDIYFVIKK